MIGKDALAGGIALVLTGLVSGILTRAILSRNCSARHLRAHRELQDIIGELQSLIQRVESMESSLARLWRDRRG